MVSLFAFQAGMLFERTKYCREHFKDVYDSILDGLHNNSEFTIKRSRVKDLAYKPKDVIETILIDINNQLGEQGKKDRVYIKSSLIHFKLKVFK